MKVFSFLLAISTAFAWPNPQPCSGNCTFIHDPAVIRRQSDGKYFRFSTMGNLAVATADSLQGPWEYQGPVFPSGAKIPTPDGDGAGIWAPDISYVDGQYVLYYCVSFLGDKDSDIGVATSSDMESWDDHGSVGIPKDANYNLIDPNFFRESDSSTPYLGFGSAWHDIFQIELDKGVVSVATDAASAANQVYNNTGSISEGSFLFWWPVDDHKYYFMFFSSGACCNRAFDPNQDLAPAGDEYKIMVCRSDSPTGPFTDQSGVDCLNDNGGTLVLGSHDNVYAPGGQGVYVDPADNKIALYYHYVNPSLSAANPYDYANFQFGYNYIDFSGGWPEVIS